MSDTRIDSASSVRIQSVDADTYASSPQPDPQQQASLDVLTYDGGQYSAFGGASPAPSRLPDFDDSALALDIQRIITEAQQERSDDVKERALNAAARMQDMVAQYNAAMERFREAQVMAQMAMNADAGQYDAYAFDAAAGASEAAAVAQEMSELAVDCGASAEMVAQFAMSAAAQADVAMAQAEVLSETAASATGADAAVLIEEPQQSPIEHAAALAARLVSPSFVADNQAAAELTASALAQIAANYNPTTAAQLAAPLAYWSNIAEQHLAAGTWLDEAATAARLAETAPPTAPAPADISAPSPPAPVAVQGNPFWAIGDAGATGQQSVAGQAITAEQYIQDKALVLVTRTVDEMHYTEVGESSYATTVQVERQFTVSIGEAARERNLDAAQAAAYLEQNGVYMINNHATGTRAEFEAAHGRAPSAADRAYLLRPETVMGSDESGNYVTPAVYGTAPQHLRAAGHDLGVYEWLPADVIAAAQASTGGHVLLASSDQVTTVQAHLDEQAMVFVEKLVVEATGDNYGEGGMSMVQVARPVAVPTFQAAVELGLSGAGLAAYAEANRGYLLSDGTVGTRAAFEAAEQRAPSDADRAYVVGAPTQYSGESGDIFYPARIGSQATYFGVIGLSADTPRDLTISFNNSRARGGDAYLDTSRRTLDLTQPSATAARAYHAVANDALAGEWVQIGDKGPIYDDVANMLGDVYGQFGADTPEKQEIVRGLLFRYDPNYGVIANRDLVKAAVEMNNNRGGNGFFQSAIGRALVTVVATVVGGPVLAAGVSAAFTAYDGGSLGDIVTAGAAAYAGGVAGAGVGGAVTSSLASSSLSATTVAAASGFAQGVSSSFTSQLIATGRIDGDALLMSGVAGGVGGAVTTAVSGTDIVANVDSSLALAPGTTARLIGTQAGSLAGSGELNLESALLVLGSGSVNDTGGSLVVDGATPADAAISDYEARGYTSEEAEVLRSMGITPGAAPEVQRGEVPPAEEAGIQVIPTDPKTRRMMAVGNAFNTLSSNPNLTVEINQTPQGAQIIDIWTREGTQVTYAFMNGELMGVRTNLDRVATGTGARMQQVSTMADELRANPNLSINATNNYRTGTQQILITSAGQPAVQYNYQDGVFVSVSYPDQLRTTTEYVNDAARYGIPHDTARLWADRAVAGQSLVASTIPADVVATGQLATVAIHTSEPGQVGRDSASGVLAVANIDGVDRAVLITANHVVRPGESTVLSARDTMGRLVQIPFDGQTMLSTGIAGDNGRVAMGSTAASDGYLVTLSPETLNALRPGASLANLPRVGPPPNVGAAVYEFGFAAWGNVNVAGQYTGTNLVGAAGRATGGTNGIVTTGVAASASNPPVIAGMSGGPVLVKLPDGSIQVVGVLATSQAQDSTRALTNQRLGTSFISHINAFASLYWLLYRAGPVNRQ